MTLIEHIIKGNAAQATALIEKALKHKTFEHIQSQKQSVAEQTFGVGELVVTETTTPAETTSKGTEPHQYCTNCDNRLVDYEKGKCRACTRQGRELPPMSEDLTHRPLPRIQNGRATTAQQFYNHFRQIGMSVNDAKQRLQHARIHKSNTQLMQDPEARKALVGEFRAIQEYIKRMSHAQGMKPQKPVGQNPKKNVGSNGKPESTPKPSGNSNGQPKAKVSGKSNDQGRTDKQDARERKDEDRVRRKHQD